MKTPKFASKIASKNFNSYFCNQVTQTYGYL